MKDSRPVIDWLMAGDPAIRWQTLRDLLDAPRKQWQAEQRCTAEIGWGAQLLERQDPDGGWGGGVYVPKWISTTYTLLTLRRIGLSRDCEAGGRGAALLIDTMLGGQADEAFARALTRCDRCVVGMILELAVYFGVRDNRIEAVVDNLLSERMPDGGWNCRRGRKRYRNVQHSSFHTTFNVLEGLREYVEAGPARSTRRAAVLAAERGALDFMLAHRLYRSHKTGEVIDPRFSLLSFPYRWHYDILRGLDYFARAGAPRDRRLGEAITLLQAHRRADGYWPVQHKYAGKVFFDMEKTGGPSRWNTLRALRVMRWWEGR